MPKQGFYAVIYSVTESGSHKFSDNNELASGQLIAKAYNSENPFHEHTRLRPISNTFSFKKTDSPTKIHLTWDPLREGYKSNEDLGSIVKSVEYIISYAHFEDADLGSACVLNSEFIKNNLIQQKNVGS